MKTSSMQPAREDVTHESEILLERELAAAWRNHVLLRRSREQVVRNNTRLRTGVRELLDVVPKDGDLAWLIENLQAVIALPIGSRGPTPEEPRPDEGERPEEQGNRIAFLAKAVNDVARICYLLQETCVPVIQNSDAIRRVLRELIERVAIDDECRDGDDATTETTPTVSIMDRMAMVLKAGADPAV